MKKFYLILFFLLLNIMHSYSQESGKIVYLKEFRAEGVVLPLTYKQPFNLRNFKELYDPAITDIILTECLIKFFWDSLRVSSNLSYKKLKYWRRQYFFYLTQDNKKVAIVFLLNFKNKRKAKKYFFDWKKELIIGLGGFYEENVIILEVNLTDVKVDW